MFERRVVIRRHFANVAFFSQRGPSFIAALLTVYSVATVAMFSERTIGAQDIVPKAATRSDSVPKVQSQEYELDQPDGLIEFECGILAPGECATSEITVRNTGSKPWTIDRVNVDSANLSAKTSAKTVPPGGSVRLVVKFTAGVEFGDEFATAECIFSGDSPGCISIEAGATVRPHVLLSRFDDIHGVVFMRLSNLRSARLQYFNFKVYQYDSEDWDTFKFSIPDAGRLIYRSLPAIVTSPHPAHPTILPTRVWDLSFHMKLGAEPHGKYPSERSLTAVIVPIVDGKELAPREVTLKAIVDDDFEFVGDPISFPETAPVSEGSFRGRVLLSRDVAPAEPELKASLVGSNPGIELTDVVINRDKPYSFRINGKIKVTLPRDALRQFKQTPIGIQHPDWHLLVRFSNGEEVFWPIVWLQ